MRPKATAVSRSSFGGFRIRGEPFGLRARVSRRRRVAAPKTVVDLYPGFPAGIAATPTSTFLEPGDLLASRPVVVVEGVVVAAAVVVDRLGVVVAVAAAAVVLIRRLHIR